MIKVAFEEKDNQLTLKLKGHAGQADIGHDIVCASCSILAYTVAQIVKTAGIEGDLQAVPVLKLDSGDAEVTCEPWEEEEAYGAIKSAYVFAQVGYNLLAHNFPEFVKLKPFGTESNP